MALSAAKIKAMSAADVRKACKRAGIETTGVPLSELRSALAGSDAPAKSTKKPAAKGTQKPGGGKRNPPPRTTGKKPAAKPAGKKPAAKPATKPAAKKPAAKPTTKAKGGMAPKPSGVTMEQVLEAITEALEPVFAKLNPIEDRLESLVSQVQETLANLEASPGAADDDEQEESTAEVPEALADYVDEEGDLAMDEETINGLKTAELKALGAYWGVELSGNNLAKREQLVAFLNGDSEDDGEDEDAGEDGESYDQKTGPNEEVAEVRPFADLSVEEEVYVSHEGEWYHVVITDTGTDEDGDAFITVTDGEDLEATVFDLEGADPAYEGVVVGE